MKLSETLGIRFSAGHRHCNSHSSSPPFFCHRLTLLQKRGALLSTLPTLCTIVARRTVTVHGANGGRKVYVSCIFAFNLRRRSICTSVARLKLRCIFAGGRGEGEPNGGRRKRGELQTQKGNKRRERGAGRNATSLLPPPSLHRRPGKAGSKYSGSTVCEAR